LSGFIKIEMHAGTSIERACEDAHHVANTLRINCEFEFNGVWCIAVPQGFASLLVKRQQTEQARELSGPFDRRFASSNPRVKAKADAEFMPVDEQLGDGVKDEH
jgi:hypothetical protein